MINNDHSSFQGKIQKAKEAVLEVMGKSTCTHFYKKFLLRKDHSNQDSFVPIDLSGLDENCYEETQISETFIDAKSPEGEVLSCSVEKRGSGDHFVYTHKMTIQVSD